MAYRPSRDPLLSASQTNPFWTAMEPLYDAAAPLSPLPRDDSELLDAYYVRERKGDRNVDREALTSRLPREFHQFRLGVAETDIIDLLMNYESDRVLAVTGRRGAGKTSLLHYLEAISMRSGHPRSPIFLILDCLQLPDHAVARDVTSILVEELRHRARIVPHTFSEGLITAANDITSLEISEAIALQRLARSVGAESSRLVVVFDNLDQCSDTIVSQAFDLARQFYVAAHIAVLLVVRPGTLRASYGRGDARAFVHYQVRVTAPTALAWLSGLTHRLRWSLNALIDKNEMPPAASGRPLTDLALNRVIDGLIRELDNRRHPGDSSLDIIEAMAADDNRHLVQLIRRTLMHRDFPASEFSEGRSPIRAFHPLSALFEGPWLVFRHSDTVPNLLSFDSEDGNFDFLLLHRILSLLKDPPRTVLGNVLLRRLEILGYSRVVCIQAFDLMHRSLLIEAKDHAAPVGERWAATEMTLTEGGSYFIDHVLGMADYGLCVALDVPLAHKLLKDRLRSTTDRSEPDFAARLGALTEYAVEVRKREQAQLRRLTTVSPSADLRAVADSLRHDGLLLSSICEAISAAVQRSESSDSNSARRATRMAARDLSGLQRSLEGMESRLDEIMNRGRKEPQREPDDVSLGPFAYPGSTVAVTLEGGGEGGISIDGTAEPELGLLAISIRFTIGADTMHVAAPLATQDDYSVGQSPPGRPIGAFVPTHPNWSETDVVDAVRTALVSFGARPDERQSGERREIALLSAYESRGVTELRLTVSEGNNWGDSQLVGTIANVQSIVEDCNETIGTIVVSAQSTAADVSQSLMELGTRLRRSVLSPEGANCLASVVHQVSSLVYVAGEDGSQIPIELIVLEGLQRGERFAMSSRWSVIRWSGHFVDGLARLASVNHHPPHFGQNQGLISFGLEPEAERPWRVMTDTVQAIQSSAATSVVMHLIGHYDVDRNRILVGSNERQVAVGPETFESFPISGLSDVVLSACGNGTASTSHNIAAAIARSMACRVWVPVCKITDGFAAQVDDIIAAELRSNPTNPSLRRVLRSGESWGSALGLYAQYGIW